MTKKQIESQVANLQKQLANLSLVVVDQDKKIEQIASSFFAVTKDLAFLILLVKKEVTNANKCKGKEGHEVDDKNIRCKKSKKSVLRNDKRGQAHGRRRKVKNKKG